MPELAAQKRKVFLGCSRQGCEKYVNTVGILELYSIVPAPVLYGTAQYNYTIRSPTPTPCAAQAGAD